MNTGEGLHRFVDPVDDEVYLYSQFEVADSRRVFAVFEQPDIKGDLHLHGHGARPLDGRVGQPHARARAGRRRRRRRGGSRPPRCSSSYVTAVIAGPYHVERAS